MIEMQHRRRRAWLFVLPCLLVALVLAGCAQSRVPPRAPVAPPTQPTTTVPPAAATTQHRTFAPYQHGVLVTPVAGRQSGTCWTTSISVPRPGVYRCLAANQIFDPCYTAPGRHAATTVACFTDPWSAATLVTVRGGLPRGQTPVARSTPWALELANGATCVGVTGTVRTFDGMPLNYTCARGRSASLPRSAGKRTLLRAEYGLASKGHTLQSVLVTVAWN